MFVELEDLSQARTVRLCDSQTVEDLHEGSVPAVRGAHDRLFKADVE